MHNLKGAQHQEQEYLPGYEMKPGYECNKSVRVEDMEDFTDMSLKIEAPGTSFNYTCQVVGAIELPKPGIIFPLKKEYNHQRLHLSSTRHNRQAQRLNIQV